MNFDSREYIGEPALTERKINSFEYASALRRFVALIIDSIILAVILAIVCTPLVVISAFSDPYSDSGMLLLLFIVPLAAIVLWLYNARLESSRFMGTPGKILMGIIVTDLDGDRISFGKATIRFIGKELANMTLILFIISSIFVFTSDSKQTLYDMIAGTLVVTKD